MALVGSLVPGCREGSGGSSAFVPGFWIWDWQSLLPVHSTTSWAVWVGVVHTGVPGLSEPRGVFLGLLGGVGVASGVVLFSELVLKSKENLPGPGDRRS